MGYVLNSSIPSGTHQPVCLTPPTITGTPAVASILTGAPGTWLGAPSLTYQWLRDGVAIVGATTTTYTVASGDSTHSISFQVSAVDGPRSTAAKSAPLAIP